MHSTGHESEMFQDLFHSSGLTYMTGGVASGFKKVDRNAFTTRLLHVKGKRNIQVAQVPIEVSSLNEGDVFILDAGRDIFQWNGKTASRMEKQKAMDVTRKIRDEERKGKATVHILDDGDDDKLFWNKFGKPKPSSVAAATDDAAHEKLAKEAVKFYHLSDETGKLVVKEIKARSKHGKLMREHLDKNDAYIIETPAGLFGWVGKKCSPGEKKNCMQYAMAFIQKKGLPDWTPVSRVAQGAEPPLFKQFFESWKEAGASVPGRPLPGQKKPFVKPVFDSTTMNAANRTREETPMPDDGTGTCTIWRIEDMKKVPLPEDQYGEFFGGDSYIILYEYKTPSGKPAAFIYFWLGLKSSQDEMACAAKYTVDLDDEMGGFPVQVRVVQNKEPPHFMLIFKNKLIIHMGGKASGFKNRDEEDVIDDDGTRLFHIRGTSETNVRAVQVPERASNLNAGDCFVFETPNKLYLWFGTGCLPEERAFTLQIYPLIDRLAQKHLDVDPAIVMEGRETAEFWEGFERGKEEYAQNALIADKDAPEPRLFQCSNNKGYFYAEEIWDFAQEDLIVEDVMLLDAGPEVYIWIGSKSNDEEKKGALSLATDYVKNDGTDRTVEDTCFQVLKQGMEPPSFTCHFGVWEEGKFGGGKTYEELKAEMQEKNPDAATISLSLDDELKKYTPGGIVYPYEELSGKGKDALPEGVDATKLEDYLSEEEFVKYFKMTKEAYDKLPKWKATGLKRAAKLF